MSNPNPTAEREEYLANLRKECYLEAGLVYSGKNFDGQDEYIGTQEKWIAGDNLYEEKLLVTEF